MCHVTVNDTSIQVDGTYAWYASTCLDSVVDL
jgi:hypothetical protein